MQTGKAAPDHEHGDPFGEQGQALCSKRVEVLGAVFEFQGNSVELMALLDLAYAGLPPLGPDEGEAPRFRIELRLTEGEDLERLSEPPEARMQGGAGLFCALMDGANFAIVDPAQRRGLVGISRALLERFPYHARYELIEFAVFVLASRGQDLVPLHAACVGLDGKGLLLLGESGAGKSTLALQCLRLGLDFLSEDAVFVEPQSLRTVGVANFLHLRRDGLALVDDAGIEAQIATSPVIRRRSGVEKFELDLRQPWARLAPAPLTLVGLVFLSGERAGLDQQDLTPLALEQWLPRFSAVQGYAAQQPSWRVFEQHFPRLAAFELRRLAHPRDGALALRSWLASR